MMRYLAVALLSTLVPATGEAASAPALPSDAHSVIARMLERNPSLESYRARVHVDVRMLNFPFLSPKLDGTSYYRRPDTYEVVFDRVPGYAKGFQRIFDDVGDPGVWERDENVAVDGTQSLWGHPMIVLRLTKKIRSTILDHSLAYVDPYSYALVQMEWYYTSGGKITMTQTYREQGLFSVLSAQHATIDIPHVHAVADASYGTYQTNVALGTGDPRDP
jgi:outer membrane lipoprotein-sorting protein